MSCIKAIIIIELAVGTVGVGAARIVGAVGAVVLLL